jgi:hypothetical protein
VSRATERVNDYSHCKNNSIEGAMMGIMEDVIQHCFKDEVLQLVNWQPLMIYINIFSSN